MPKQDKESGTFYHFRDNKRETRFELHSTFCRKRQWNEVASPLQKKTLSGIEVTFILVEKLLKNILVGFDSFALRKTSIPYLNEILNEFTTSKHSEYSIENVGKK